MTSGLDRLTGRDFSDRRGWIREYLPRLCELFGVEADFHVEMQHYLCASDKGLLPRKPDEYLERLDWTGRQLANGKRGGISQHFAPLLDRLGINRGMWLDLVTQFDRLFGHVVGRTGPVVERAAQAGRRCQARSRQLRRGLWQARDPSC